METNVASGMTGTMSKVSVSVQVRIAVYLAHVNIIVLWQNLKSVLYPTGSIQITHEYVPANLLVSHVTKLDSSGPI